MRFRDKKKEKEKGYLGRFMCFFWCIFEQKSEMRSIEKKKEKRRKITQVDKKRLIFCL